MPLLRPHGVLRLSDIAFSFEPADAEAQFEQWCTTLPEIAAPDEWTRGDVEDRSRPDQAGGGAVGGGQSACAAGPLGFAASENGG